VAAEGLRVLYEEERKVAGLEFLTDEEATIVVAKDPHFAGLVFKVFCKTASSDWVTMATRSLSDSEIEGLCHMSARGIPLDRGSVAHAAWLSDLVEIQGLEHNCDAHVHLRGYDDKLESVAPLRDDLHGMLDLQRDRARSWQRGPEVTDSDSVGKRSEIVEAARCFGIRAEVAEALYDYFKKVDTSGNGLIEEEEFRVCLLNLCQMSAQAIEEEARIHRYWCELRAQAPDHQLDFRRFTEWLVTKFPHVADMTSWQIRRFAGIYHAPTPRGSCANSAFCLT
jgi:hypothetical protein